MKDPCILILTELLRNPNKPLKVYIELLPIARATFFAAKAQLEARGVVQFVDRKQLTVDRAAARRFLQDVYPGLVTLLEEAAFSVAAADEAQNLPHPSTQSAGQSAGPSADHRSGG